jgi:hypothetical protein
MHEILDVKAHESLIKEYIKRFAFRPEHHFEYLTSVGDGSQPAFYYDEEMGAIGDIHHEGKDKVFWMTVEPLAKDPAAALEKISKYLIEEKGYGKVVVESLHSINEELKKKLTQTNYRILKPRWSSEWPVFHMKNFDETLSGSNWKKIRYYKNKFFKDHPDATVEDIIPEDGQALKELVKGWVKKRTAGDRAHYKGFFTIIDSNFKNYDIAKVIKIGGKPVSFFAGFKVPYANGYYSCIGIYDYDIENIGSVSNVLDLIEIKKLGAEWADFGGSEIGSGLANFKRKFHPDEFYYTDVYTITRN